MYISSTVEGGKSSISNVFVTTLIIIMCIAILEDQKGTYRWQTNTTQKHLRHVQYISNMYGTSSDLVFKYESPVSVRRVKSKTSLEEEETKDSIET